MATFCGLCGNPVRFTQPSFICATAGCSVVAHRFCTGQCEGWRCRRCVAMLSRVGENSVQFLLMEILKKGSGLELLQGLIGKINDLVTDINAIKDENENLKVEIAQLTSAGPREEHKRKTASAPTHPQPVVTIDLVEDDPPPVQPVLPRRPPQTPHKVSLFVTWTGSSKSEAYLKNLLETNTGVKSLECIRVSCYDSKSMFHIKVDQEEFHLINNADVYPQGCKIDICGR